MFFNTIQKKNQQHTKFSECSLRTFITMPFLSKVKSFLSGVGSDNKKRSKVFTNIKKGVNPLDIWEVVEEIGDGAFGKVYKTKQKENGTYAALKKVDIESEDQLEDFSIEIDILTEAKHENVVEMYESFLFDSKLWMFIEYCEGGAVDSIMIDLEKPLTEEQIVPICHQIVEGLKYLHSNHIIHRDLKAGNVLLTADGGVKLADFGVSAKNKNTLQKRDSFIGTPFWMSPEVILCETIKDSPYDYKADIWSLGITLIEFAEMEPPNHEMHPMRVLTKIRKSDPPTLIAQKSWSSNFNDFLKKCLVKDPEQRASASDLLKHPFLAEKPSKKSIVALLSEAKAEVVITSTEIEDHQLKDVELHLDVPSADSVSLSSDVTSSVGDSTPKVLTPEKNIKTPIQQPSVDKDDISPSKKSNLHLPLNEPISLSEDNEPIIKSLVEDFVQELILSETDQPSVYSVVLDSIDDFIISEPPEDPQADDNESISPPTIPPRSPITPTSPRLSSPTSPTQLSVNSATDSVTRQGVNSRLEDQEIHVNIGESSPGSSKPSSPQSMSPANRSSNALPTSETTTTTHLISRPGLKDQDLSDPNNSNPVQLRQPNTDNNSNSLLENRVPHPNGRTAQHSAGDSSTATISRQEHKSNYRTINKTRRYFIDGQEHVSHTSKVVISGQENKNREEYAIWKADLRELKLLQKQENRQYTDLVVKAEYMRDQQDNKFKQETQALLRKFETDIEHLNKQQKQSVERAELAQGLDLKLAAKKHKLDQEKEYKVFKDSLKQELKLLKQEVELLPREKRKETMRKSKEDKEAEHSIKERRFLENQVENSDKSLKHLSEKHREKVALLEKEFLRQKQELLRVREASIWKLEEKQLEEKQQLATRQLKDLFFLKRHQMLTRHDKELEQMKRKNGRKEDEMLQKHVLEKKRLPKIQRSDMKTRAQLFKQSLRISQIGTIDDEREKIKQFDESEKKRMKSEQLKQELKHKKQWDTLKSKSDAALKELEQIQREKRKLLMEHETSKLYELDTQYQTELRELKSQRCPRKQMLEEEFAKQTAEQDKFYSGAFNYSSKNGNTKKSNSSLDVLS